MKTSFIIGFVISLILPKLVMAGYDDAAKAMVENDYKAAYQVLSGLADSSNDFRVFNALGSLYYKGQGVSRDVHKSIQYYEKAADLGDPRACVSLAIIYGNDIDDFKGDKQKQLFFARKAAQLKNPDGQFLVYSIIKERELSFLKKDGSVDRDRYKQLMSRSVDDRDLDVEAYTNLSLAAESGHPQAMGMTATVLSEWVGNDNRRRSLRMIDFIQKNTKQYMSEKALSLLGLVKSNLMYFDALGNTRATPASLPDIKLIVLPAVYVFSKKEYSLCPAKVVSANVVTPIRDVFFLPLEKTKIIGKDSMLIRGAWEESWVFEICDNKIEAKITFISDGINGLFINTSMANINYVSR